jgi:hypothetical protein
MVTRGAKLREAIDTAPKDAPGAKDDPVVKVDPAAKADLVAKDLPFSQRKRPEAGRYLLQVDRQTKASYNALETAEAAGLAIKTNHPIVQVSVYDTVECANKLLELPAS